MAWGADIDEAYAPFAANITAFADLLGVYEDAARTQRLRATRIEIETPFELELRATAKGVGPIGAAPPVYRTETTIMPVFHTMRMTLVPATGLYRDTLAEAVDGGEGRP
jgi:hypothetical protein